MPKPTPLAGIARSCSLIALIEAPGVAAGVRRTGNRLLNQPTVRLGQVDTLGIQDELLQHHVDPIAGLH